MLKDNLKYYLNAKNVSVSNIAKSSGVYSSKIYDLINGKVKELSLTNTAKIAKALDITIDELYYGTNIEMNSPAGEIKMEE